MLYIIQSEKGINVSSTYPSLLILNEWSCLIMTDDTYAEVTRNLRTGFYDSQTDEIRIACESSSETNCAEIVQIPYELRFKKKLCTVPKLILGNWSRTSSNERILEEKHNAIFGCRFLLFARKKVFGWETLKDLKKMRGFLDIGCLDIASVVSSMSLFQMEFYNPKKIDDVKYVLDYYWRRENKSSPYAAFRPSLYVNVVCTDNLVNSCFVGEQEVVRFFGGDYWKDDCG